MYSFGLFSLPFGLWCLATLVLSFVVLFAFSLPLTAPSVGSFFLLLLALIRTILAVLETSANIHENGNTYNDATEKMNCMIPELLQYQLDFHFFPSVERCRRNTCTGAGRST